MTYKPGSLLAAFLELSPEEQEKQLPHYLEEYEKYAHQRMMDEIEREHNINYRKLLQEAREAYEADKILLAKETKALEMLKNNATLDQIAAETTLSKRKIRKLAWQEHIRNR